MIKRIAERETETDTNDIINNIKQINKRNNTAHHIEELRRTELMKKTFGTGTLPRTIYIHLDTFY